MSQDRSSITWPANKL